MNCQQARFYFSELASHSLSDTEEAVIRGHLASCAECRVGLGRVQKLRGLLALKRHEQPSAFFHNTFLEEFHRRMYAEVAHARTPTLWQRIASFFDWNLPASLLKGGALATAAALLIMLGVSMHIDSISSNLSASREYVTHSSRSSTHLSKPKALGDFTIATHPHTVYALERVAQVSSAYANNVLTF